MNYAWIFFGLLSAFFAALVAIFAKLGLTIDNTLATTLRSSIMFLVLFVVSLSLGKFKLLYTVDRRALLFIILGALAGASSWLAYFYALQIGPASKVASLDRLSMVFVIFLAAFFLGEALTWKSIVGALFLVIGAILVSLSKR